MAESRYIKTAAEIEAEVALHYAEAAAKNNEARKLAAEAMTAECHATAAALDLEKKKEAREVELASDRYAHLYRFTTQVSDKSVPDCINVLSAWARITPGCPIEIVFNSPGGNVIDGMALFDFLKGLEHSGHHLTTTALGIAASMAGILMQAGQTRRMGKEAWVLIHQGSFGASGSYGSVEDTVEWVKKIQERILDIFATRVAQSNASHPMSRAQIKRNWERKDWWLSSADCLKFGFVDEVL